MSSEYVVVGRIGKAHGIKGELMVEPRTDEPERRFAPGAVLRTTTPSSPTTGTLTVSGIRFHQGRLLVRFEGITDRTEAEAARGTLLEVEIDPGELPDDPEEFYDHQLVGLKAVTTDDRPVGEVIRVQHGAAQDLLVIRTESGEALVPFVSELVPAVDLDAREVRIEDRPGLLDIDEAQ